MLNQNDVKKEVGKCPRCGSYHLAKCGWAYSNRKGTKRQKFKCQDCGLKIIGKIKHIVEPMPFKYQEQPLPPQNWTAITQAQNSEKKLLMEILQELLSKFKIVDNPTKLGRKFADPRDMLFCLALKTYTKLSSRRLNSDLEIAKQNSFISEVPHFTTLMNYLEKSGLTDALQELIKLSALPTKELETEFAIDSTGFSSNQFGRWFNYKYNKETVCRNWIKAHVMIGTKTNMVTSIELTKAHGADSPQLAPLVEKTCENFNVKEVSADMAYLSRKNLQIIVNNGAVPFIPFKENSQPNKKGSMIWAKMYQYCKEKPQEFFEQYHRRSNVETTFSMLKQKFGKDVMSKNFTSQTNEVLLKILCHNICCLISAYFEKNIENYYPTDHPKKEVILRLG